MASFLRSCGQHTSGQNHIEDSFRRTPQLQAARNPALEQVLKLSHIEAFGQDSDLVKEARKEFFLKHSYNFITEGTCDLSEIFRQMVTSARLLGTSIYEIQVSWTEPDELR